MPKNKFREKLRKDLTVRRTGLLGLGRKVEVSNGATGSDRLSYTVDRRSANEDTAAFINSKIPVATIRPKI